MAHKVKIKQQDSAARLESQLTPIKWAYDIMSILLLKV